jgi:signal transduction histidine kinase
VATLKGLLRLAKLDQQDKKSNQYFEMMQETTIHLEEMTKTIQLVYEIKSRELILEKVNLKTFLETNIITIIKNGEKVAVGISGDDDIFVNTDVDLLKTAIKELARNSVQYHNNEDKCTLLYHVLKKNQWLHLEVEDNGDGIDSEKQSNLFNLFNRGHENSTGTGLGLYIAKTCMERLHGTISFLPNTKKGTKFLLRLPL